LNAVDRAGLEKELALLHAELRERRANLPAHTVRPHQLLALEDLEVRIAEVRRQLDAEPR